MAIERDVRREVASYLARAGWKPGQGGASGELWFRSGDSVDQRPGLAVPYEFEADSLELAAVVKRLSMVEQRDASDVADELEREFLDVQQYRIADRFVTDESVLLESASTVLSAARRLLRAAATTARKPRAQIGPNFSAPADEIAARARLAHTRRGSFVLPIVMPVEPPEQSENDLIQGLAPIEPSERRVTRTLATALAALDNIAIKPGRMPRADDVMALIQSGVSRELVTAVRAIASESGVHAFDTKFKWAPGVGSPGGIPERVVISDDAVTLLGKVEDQLRKVKPEPDQSVSGQIIQIRYIPGDATGEIAIRTIRNNRNVEIRITEVARTVVEAYDWAHSQRAIIARGLITRAPGKPLSMPDPSVVRPLDELFVVKNDSVD
jgi:hypothetical protein